MIGTLLFLAAIDCVGTSVGLAELARREQRYDASVSRTLGLMALCLLVAGGGFLISARVV